VDSPPVIIANPAVEHSLLENLAPRKSLEHQRNAQMAIVARQMALGGGHLGEKDKESLNKAMLKLPSHNNLSLRLQTCLELTRNSFMLLPSN